MIVLKKVLFSLFIFLIIISPVTLAADDVEKQLENLDTQELDSFLRELNREYGDYVPSYDLKDLINTLRGNQRYDLRGLINGIIRYVFREITANYHLLAKLVALSVICAVLKNLQHGFEKDNIGRMAYSAVYLVLVVIAVQSFIIAINTGRDAISDMVSFVHALMPTVFTLLAAIGGMTSVSVFNPLIFIGITAASTWIKDIILPVIFFISVLSLVNNISDSFHVSHLAHLLRQVCVFLLGFFLSVFLGIMVVQGAAAATVDGISIRTAKFASKNFMPIVGGIFSDALDAVVGCSLILKNTVGLIGLLLIFIITLFPVIKILSIIFIYRLSAAIIQPVGEESIVRCLNDIGNSLTMVFVSVASVAMMFFIAMTIILASGNLAVMLR
ncbi:stage III sporulation protein AE [Thermosediminibacter litoriperuensis]|uniref:stage III sporulation protein AE n=1 Tax=Thermosediminibacter litoriperuensis TaxID=291989 RepID=UPI0014789F38|nr:stage III sporulation protein AE [Thermosediminibacter litoriperuensis]